MRTILMLSMLCWLGIDFRGKNVRVYSAAGPAMTTIKGGGTNVTFQSGEPAAATLEGFTLSGGKQGILVIGSSPTILNNHIHSHATGRDGRGGGIQCLAGSNPWIEGNLTGAVTVSFSNVQGGWPGNGNLDQDPLLVAPFRSDYRIQAGSPCVDRGDPSASLSCRRDAYGNPRELDGSFLSTRRLDMGAHEFSNVNLWIAGDPAAGGELTVGTYGTAGLPVILLVGAPGLQDHPALGCLFLDLAQPWWAASWGGVGTTFSVPVPAGTPPGLTVAFQALASTGSAGNLSNDVVFATQ